MFLDRAHGAVVEITCGSRQCSTPEMAVELARRVLPRLAQLSTTPPATQAAPAAPAPKPGEPTPTPEPPAPPDQGGFQLKPPGVLSP